MPNEIIERFIELEPSKNIRYLTNQNKGKPKMVMLHGVNVKAESFIGFFPYITEHYEIFAPDFRGHGKSFRSQEPYIIANYASDINLFINKVVGEDCLLVGMSLGGRVGVRLAAKFPNLIKKLVVVDAGPDVQPEGLDRLIKAQAMLPTYFNSLAELENYFMAAYKNKPKHYIDAVIKNAWQQNSEGRFVTSYDRSIWNLTPEMLINDANMLNECAVQVDVPVLIIRAGLSDILTPQDAQKFLAKLKYGELVEIPNTTHGVMAEEPVKCANIINEFFAK